ncbi:amidohydrolase [Lachnospiraceae bacterium NSJ-143]|nr:amidohydrolase [Lachnospiraceae bacterium NSJ-143]
MGINYRFVDENLKKELVELRRMFHRFPEAGWMEFLTTCKIVEYLDRLGFKVFYGQNFLKPGQRWGQPLERFVKESMLNAEKHGVPRGFIDEVKNGFTGAAGVMRFSESGPVCVFRFDIDGLRITESTKEGHRPFELGFSSENENYMHACGHDGHMAVGLCLAKILSDNRHRLKGEARFIFQPAEEGCRGGQAVAESGFIESADYVLGGHIGVCSLKKGETAAVKGGFLCTTKLDIHFLGHSAHASNSPESGRNALLAAAEFVLSANAIPRHSGGATMVNIGVLNAGEGRNIIPDTAYVEAETRGETQRLNEYMKTELIRRANGAAAMYGCEVEIEMAGEAGGFASNADLKAAAKEICGAMGEGVSYAEKNFGASEDFSNLAVEAEKYGAKSAYFTFGSAVKGVHHSPEFDFDEDTMALELEFFARAAQRFMGSED